MKYRINKIYVANVNGFCYQLWLQGSHSKIEIGVITIDLACREDSYWDHIATNTDINEIYKIIERFKQENIDRANFLYEEGEI